MMSHRNATQKGEVIEFNSYTSAFTLPSGLRTMKPALARIPDDSALEDLGRATFQIVHDLKNQLNGLKLYATFLRKRLEREERSIEERETLVKLIAGLDRAARDMTTLVRYAQPIELHCRPCTDLMVLIPKAVEELRGRLSGHITLSCEIESTSLSGEFDPAALAEAVKAVTDEAINSLPSREGGKIRIQVRRESTAPSPEAKVEWQGVQLAGRNHSLRSESNGTVYSALAARIIEAHGGRFESGPNFIRAWLPLSE
jgi:signal transduction histidine kinase